jgi:ribonuclease HII
MVSRRQSPRLQALHAASSSSAPSDQSPSDLPNDSNKKKRKRSTAGAASKPKPKKQPAAASSAASATTATTAVNCLPRTIEHGRLSELSCLQYVIGIDEAGRGPLAGPVVAAAVWAPVDLEGIVDSKKITKEEERERLFEELLLMENIQWAVGIIDAQRIDEINILQATLEGMRMAATALVNPNLVEIPIQTEPSVDHLGSYVVYSSSNVKNTKLETTAKAATTTNTNSSPYYALIDGNKVPKDMPCPAESIVKGDGKEFCIAAASVLAKVTRDRLMHSYDKLYPDYNLKQHKGYPTKAHMQAVFKHGASPIHRRTFAPLKHMEFDENGRILKQP